jgi:hypothetical protein
MPPIVRPHIESPSLTRLPRTGAIQLPKKHHLDSKHSKDFGDTTLRLPVAVYLPQDTKQLNSQKFVVQL